METKEPDSRLSVRKEDLEDQELYNLNKIINDLYSKITTARDETDDAVKKFTRSGVISSVSDQSAASLPPPVEGGIPQPQASDWTLNSVVYSAGEDGLQYGFASASINSKPAVVDYYSMFIQDYSSGYVNTSGTAVTLTSASKEAGNTFENCVAGQVININSIAYTIAANPTAPFESLTLTASAGTQTNVYFNLNPVDGKWEEIASDAEAGTWQPRPPTGWDVPCCLTASTKDQKTFEPPAGVNYKRLQFAAWGDAPQVTNFSVTVEQQDLSTTDIPSGKFVVNFTKPLDPEYYYASIERLWYVNSSFTGNIGATAIVDVSGNTVTYNSTSSIYSSTFKGQYFNYIQPGDTVYISTGPTLSESNTYTVSEVISNTQLKLTTNPPAGTERVFAQWGRVAGEINPFTQNDYWPLPTSAEYWKFRARSVNHRELANNTTPPTVNVTVPASGGITPLNPATQPGSGDWSLNALQYSISEAGTSSIFISATITTPSAGADYYSLFWQRTSTPVSGDWIEIAADATAGTWQPWPADGATYVVAIAANKNTYKLDQPDESIPSYYKTLTIPAWGAADQVTGFSVTVETDNRAGVPSGRFVFNFTKPADPDYYYAQISRIATDASYVPLSGAVYGVVAGEVNPTKQTDWWPLPETAEYWTFKSESVNYRKAVNTTAAPTSNVSVSTSSGITQIAPATITTAAFASTIRPVEIVGSLPALPSASYPEGSVVFLTTNDKLYRSTGSAWTVATDGADIVANSITGGKIAAGAISTTELFAGEILVGQGGGKPTRFTVKDSVGNTIGFIGDNGAGFVGAYLINLRVGTDINNPVILASSSGVSINGAPLTLNLNGITTVIDNTLNSIVSGYAGLRIYNTSGSTDAVVISPGKIAMSESLTATTKFFLNASTGTDTTISLYRNGGGERIRLSANSLGGIISLYNGSGVLSSQLSANGITGVEIDLTTAIKVGGVTVVDSSRNGSLANIAVTGTFTAGGSVGTSGQVLSSTGSGIQWTTLGTGVTSITGTANQINTSPASPASGAVTLSLPQDIATTSNVTFGSVTTATVGPTTLTALNLRTDNTIRWSVSSSGMFIPGASDTYDIGILSTNRVRAVYTKIVDTAVSGGTGDYIQTRKLQLFDNTGSTTGASSWDLNVVISGSGASQNSYLYIRDSVGSNVMKSDRIASGVAVSRTTWYTDLLPDTTFTRNLGSASVRWANCWVNKVDAFFTSAPPATSGTTQNGIARIGGDAGNVLDIGAYDSSPFAIWIQASAASNLSTRYPIVLNPLGGNVGIGNSNPGYALEVTGTAYISGATTINSNLVMGGSTNTMSGTLQPLFDGFGSIGSSFYRYGNVYTYALNIGSSLTAGGSTGTSGQLLASTATGIQWQNIASRLSAGTGISISGTTTATITNSGVTSITGTSNQVIASASTGGVTLSLPQSIATTSNVTFNSLTLANGASNGILIKDIGGTARVCLTIASDNNLYLDNNDSTYDIYIRPGSGRYTFVDGSYFAPFTNNTISLGYNGQGWSNVYSYNYWTNDGGVWYQGVDGTFDISTSNTLTIRNGIITAIT